MGKVLKEWFLMPLDAIWVWLFLKSLKWFEWRTGRPIMMGTISVESASDLADPGSKPN